MNINTTGIIEFNGLRLYMGMPYTDFYKAIPGFEGNRYTTVSNELIGHAGFLDSSIAGSDWSISLQVNIEGGLCAVYLQFIGEDFEDKWLGEEVEQRRKEYHKSFLSKLGLKQKQYGFGYIRCAMNKTSQTNVISIIRPPNKYGKA